MVPRYLCYRGIDTFSGIASGQVQGDLLYGHGEVFSYVAFCGLTFDMFACMCSVSTYIEHA